jgi:hypothetical protein
MAAVPFLLCVKLNYCFTNWYLSAAQHTREANEDQTRLRHPGLSEQVYNAAPINFLNRLAWRHCEYLCRSISISNAKAWLQKRASWSGIPLNT